MLSYNLNEFVIPPVVITDMAGAAVSEYNLGTSYIFHIDFTETGENQWQYYYDEQADEYYLLYQLPPEVKVLQQIEEENPYPIWGLPSMPGQPPPVVGHYSVFTDGSVKVKFDNVDIYGNSIAPTNFIDYYTDASFTLEVIAQFAHVGEEQVIDFGNNVTVTVDVLNPIDGKLDVKKTYATFDLRNENMTFTITVTAQNDAVHDIKITDTDSPTIITNIRKGVFKDMTVSVQGGAATTPPEFALLDGQPFDDGFTLAFLGVTLQPGEQIVVQFTLNFTDLIIEVTSASQATTGTFEYTIYLDNSAFAEGIDSDLTPIKSETFLIRNIMLARDFFRKSPRTDLENDYTANWVNSRLGDGLTPLNGAVISDTFTDMYFAGEYIEFNLQDIHNVTIARWRKPIPPGAVSFSITVPDAGESLVLGTRPDGTEVIWIAARPEYGEIIFVYPQTYTTVVADPETDFADTFTRKYTNQLMVSIDGENPYFVATVGIVKPGAYPTLAKENEYVYENDVPTAIKWTVTAFVPASCYGQNVSFFDDAWAHVFFSISGRRFYFADTTFVSQMIVTAEEGALPPRQLAQDVDYRITFPSGSSWRLYFIGEGSPSPFEDDTIMTFNYSVSLDAVVENGQQQMTLREALGHVDIASFDYLSIMENLFYLYNPMSVFVGISGGAVTAGTDLQWPIIKTAAVDGDIIKYRLFLTASDMPFSFGDILRDSFSEDVSYVTFSFVVRLGAKYYGPYQTPALEFDDMLAQAISGNEFEIDFMNMRHVNVAGGLATGFASDEMLHESGTPAAYIIEYQMRVRGGLIDQHIMANTADIGGFDHSAEVLYGDKVVDKTVVADSNLAEVTILINPNEERLAEDGKYTIIDSQSDTLAFYLGTVVLEAWENGEWVVKPLTNSDSGELWTWMLINTNSLHIVVPDETHFRLTYNALIRGDAGDTVDISNAVTVAEKYTDYFEESYYISDTHGSSSGDRRRVAVLKHDADDPTVFVFGAVFGLYAGYPFAGWEEVPLPPGVERSFLVGETTFYFLAQETSVADGAVFDNAWLTPTHKFIYAVVEHSPPPGYLLPADPITLFTYTPPTPEQLEKLGEKGNELIQIADNITIPNTRIEVPPISVELLMSKNAIGAPMVGGEFNFAIFDENDVQVNFALNNQNGLITFSPMEFTEPGTYEYTVKEIFAPEGWEQDTREWPIVIEVILAESELIANVSYPNGVPSFANTFLGEECGMFAFPNLTFDAPGTYEFTLKEETPSGDGWTTDDSEFRVIVDVTDDGHGNLIATMSFPDGFPNFTNTYTVTPARIIISGIKIAVGAPLPCGRFTFGLYNEAGDLIATTTNDKRQLDAKPT